MFLGFRSKRPTRQRLRKTSSFRPQVQQLDERVLLTVAVIQVDAGAGQHAINPLIYGVNNGRKDTLSYLGSTLDRSGGNALSTYNWQQNAFNSGSDYYFTSYSRDSLDKFVTDTQTAGAQPVLTVPMLPFVAKLGPGRQELPSYSVAKYGAQTESLGDAGTGILLNGNPVNNDPFDAYVASNVQFQQGWIQHLVDTFGTAANGGVKYYALDNEPSIWFEAHRDITPNGLTMDQELQNLINYGTMVKTVDPSAEVQGPEEWGWDGFIYSGADQKYIREHGFSTAVTPDKTAHGGIDYIPYLLQQLNVYQQDSGIRAMDTLTVHFYPQGDRNVDGPGEFFGGDSPELNLLRNRSTRSLWDPTYVDASYINSQVKLIPRLKEWVDTYYPGTKIGITEYSWGNLESMNGATAQADVLGIIGREGGVSMANLWDYPESTNPTDAGEYPGYKALKMYRNYDGQNSTFGETSVSTSAPNPDEVSAFSSIRASDGALTIMVTNKNLFDAANPGATTTIQVDISNFAGVGKAQVWQLAAIDPNDQTHANITQLGDITIDGNILTIMVPQESVTLLVIKPAAQGTPPQVLTVSPGTAAAGSSIVVTGSHFTGATAVLFSGQTTVVPAAAFVVNSDTQITVTVPAQGGLSNTVDIFVTTAAGKSAQSAADQFTFSASQVQPGAIQFAVATQSVNEDAGTIQITLSRTGGSDGAVTVHYATTDGTGKDGVDYEQASGSITFSAGQTSQSFNVTILNPGKFGGTSIFQITLSEPTGGATLGTTNPLTVTIVDTLPAQPIPSNLDQAALLFTHSPEAIANFVTNAYQRFLNRTPDEGGTLYWVNRLQHGLTDEQLEAGFADSPEFFTVNGGTNEGLVIGMYTTLLLREPDQTGLNFWVNQLDSGLNPSSVAFGFTASPERETIRITDDYMTYLGREPDEGGLNFWLDAFLHGARNEDLVAGFVGSQEYYEAEGKGNNNRAAWTANAYQSILHRAPKPAEIQGWERFFNQG